MKRQNQTNVTEQFDAERRDRETISAVRHRIERSRHKGLRRVKARISDGTVILSGTVASDENRAVALDLVRAVKHVDGVIDELKTVSD